ncbi:interleukin-31 receptor subunit alpha-like [Solea solea]|uniref:interleukin-31 receptor subunit alpha-like n=1 Tax=Solea solea TaxID=90069 RepID=UPI00272B95DF|nr:interleukin-31 receptor subunit alpha-like [Solea solea]
MYPILFPCVLVLFISICKGQQRSSCNVVPKDQYIEVGSNTTVFCQTSCIGGRIFWMLNNVRVNESLPNTVNSSHAVLSLRNFTLHSATLQCHSADTEQILGGTIIKTYSKPSQIRCILHYVNQSKEGMPQLFTCNWEHQNNSPLMINYTVLVSQREICNNARVHTCTSRDIHLSGDISLTRNISVTVRAKTTVWEANSDPYEFHPYRILKMIPPKLNVTVASDHLLIEWRRSLSRRRCHCQVKYNQIVSSSTPEFVLNETLSREKNGKVFVKVESCSHYKVSVRCALDGAPWSDWSQERTVLTGLNKTDVELNLWRKLTKPGTNGVRKVHVMWTGIPSTCPGTFRYIIKQIPYNDTVSGVSFAETFCSDSRRCDIDVNRDAHRINLTVFFNEALLVEDSVYVPAAAGESFSEVTEIPSSQAIGGVIVVSWKAPVQPVRGYMIDWTHNGNQYYWMETEYTNMTLSGLLEKKKYSVTVTPLFPDRTGHGSEALHICSSVGDPDNVTIGAVHASDKSADVKWSTKLQEECSGAIINYTIFYSSQEGPSLNFTVDGKQRGAFLKDLRPDVQYSVYVRATALSGTSESSERLFKTKKFDPRLSTVLSVSGSIIIILVLSLGLCCTIQWKRFKEKLVPNPGHSSLALWPSAGHQKGTCPFQAFSDPSASFCDRVYTEEMQIMPSPPSGTGCHDDRASEQTEEHTDPATVLAPDAQNGGPAEPVKTQHLCPEESTELLSSTEDNTSSAYRSQSTGESPALRTSKQCKLVPLKQEDKLAPVTVYVTLEMYEQDQGR